MSAPQPDLRPWLEALAVRTARQACGCTCDPDAHFEGDIVQGDAILDLAHEQWCPAWRRPGAGTNS